MTAPSQTPEAAGLEPCPFCGGEAWLNDYEAKYSDLPPKSRAPQCRSCGASLGYLTTPAKATEAWNRRVTAASAQAAIDAEKAKVAELEAALEEARTIDAGFWKWLGERDLQPDGPDLEWGDIVVALTEHEDNAYDIADKANDRATAAEARADRMAKALGDIVELNPIPFEGGLDMEAIRSCDECKRYEGHPVQHGICNTHRRPIWDREKHDRHEKVALAYRAKSIARAALQQEAQS